MGEPMRRREPDVVSFGRQGPPRLRLPDWLSSGRVTAGLAVVVIIAAALVVLENGHRAHRHHRLLRSGQVTVTHAGHRLLGVRAGWNLFATGPGVLVRIEPAAGVITKTAVPPLMSTGPVSFVVGPRQAVIRPLDFVPGYLVPDGRPAGPLPASLGRAGEAFPGPRPGQLWVQTGFGAQDVMSLVTYAGRPAGASVAFTGFLIDLAVPDGRGYFLVQQRGAVYDIRPGSQRRVAAGTLDAAGPSAWLVTQCSRRTCRYQVIDPASGARRLVPGRAAAPAAATTPGVIAPDGLIAAIVRTGPSRRPQVHLVSLMTGTDRVLPVTVSEPTFSGSGASSLAWSPDSRWLFAVTASGAVIAIDPATGQSRALGVPVPRVTQLAIRTGR